MTMDVEPDHAELYHYVDEHWDIVKTFNFYSPLPGKFIGTKHLIFNILKVHDPFGAPLGPHWSFIQTYNHPILAISTSRYQSGALP